MKQLLYIHGGEAFSEYETYLNHLRKVHIEPFKEPSTRWTHTLREDFGSEWEVYMPSMPSKHNAKYEEWKIWFERYFEFLNDGAILLGWSMGGQFIVKYLIENDVPFTAKALVLLAAPFENFVSDFNGEDGGDFGFDTTQVALLAKKTEKIVLLHSKDDFVVPYAHAERYATALSNSELVTYEDKNHFLVEAFPELIETISRL